MKRLQDHYYGVHGQPWNDAVEKMLNDLAAAVEELQERTKPNHIDPLLEPKP